VGNKLRTRPGKVQFEQRLQRGASSDSQNHEQGGSTLALKPQIADGSDGNEGKHRRAAETGEVPEHHL
jgi:hypothetical protein